VSIEANLEQAAYARAAHVASSGSRTFLRLTPTYFMKSIQSDSWVIGDVHDRSFGPSEEGANQAVSSNCELRLNPETGLLEFVHASELVPLQPNARQGNLQLGCDPWMLLSFDAQAIPEMDRFCAPASGEHRMWLGIADAWHQLPEASGIAGRDFPVLEVRIREWNRPPLPKQEFDAWTNPGSNYQRGVGEGLAMRGASYRIPARLLVDEQGALTPAWRQFAINYERRQRGDGDAGSAWGGALSQRRYQVEFMLPIPTSYDRFVQIAGGDSGGSNAGGSGPGGGSGGGGPDFRQAVSLPLQAQVHVDSISLVAAQQEQTFTDIEMVGYGTQPLSQGLMNMLNRVETDPRQCQPEPGLSCQTTQDRIDEPVFNCRREGWPNLLNRLVLSTFDQDKHGTAPLACPHAGRASCLPDINQDGVVSGEDMGILLGGWGPQNCHPADFNGDGAVSGTDLGILLGAWGACR
jgi:hypothetical protein